jgi:hypothetical protein
MEVEHLPPLEHGTTDSGLTERSGSRDVAAPRNAMGDNVTIQKNWQELIRPGKLQVAAGGDARRVATVVAEPLERGFGVTLGNALRFSRCTSTACSTSFPRSPACART